MKNVWENVRPDGSIVIGEERMPSKADLLGTFEAALSHNGWHFVEWTKTDVAPYQCVVNRRGTLIDIVVYLKRIGNAGWENKPECKRVQVSNLKSVEHLLMRNESATKLNLIIGYYDYEAPLYAAWDASLYVGHETNRSAYVDVDQLVEGYAAGYVETQCSGLPVTVFQPYYLTKYLDQYIADQVPSRRRYTVDHEEVRRVGALAAHLLARDPAFRTPWNGIKAVTTMRDSGCRNWRQSEWPGFYFEELALTALMAADSGFKAGMVKYGNSVIDVFNLIPWDLKAHSDGERADEVPANSTEAIVGAIDDYGHIGFIILDGDPIYDTDGSFKKWHDLVKGGASSYTRKRIERGAPSRRMKRTFIPKRIRVIVIDGETIQHLGSFQKDMRNASGTPRTEKKKIRFSTLPEGCIIADETIHLVQI